MANRHIWRALVFTLLALCLMVSTAMADTQGTDDYITLSYDFCATLIPKKYMSKCRVFVSADNIFTATKFSGMDPEVSITTTTYKLAGMYSDQYPVARNIVGGIEIEF